LELCAVLIAPLSRGGCAKWVREECVVGGRVRELVWEVVA
jgi:hypothetical protein